ncbi:MAG: hypothetical protein VKI82_11730 [Leptolyngbya sp.]|nr:hypothetical protein [Leptolyngbya sp.]
MASSSRPFQSQTLSRVLAGYRQLAHGAERWLRQTETALLWGVQVIAFPLYVAFQGLRSAARTLQATKPWRPMIALITGAPAQPWGLTSDAPIQALLAMIHPPAVSQPEGVHPGERPRALLRHSRAEGLMVGGAWQMVPLTTQVCGVASDLATRNLVIVTTNNVIFNNLTDRQRHQLQRAMTLLMAEYAGWCRRQWHDRQLQSPGLPLPQASENQWFPVRWINQALAWMQVSPLAQVTNLFGEAQPWFPAEWSAEHQRRMGGWHPALAGSGRLAFQPAPRLGAAFDYGPAFAATPYTSMTVPDGRSALGSGGVLPIPPDSAALTVVGATAMATQPQTLGEVVTYLTEDGTVIVADAPGPISLDHSAVGEEGAARSARARGARTVGGRATGKELPGNDAIEAQVALVTYVDHPLVVVLRWLDVLLHHAETWLQQAWRWLRRQA